MAEMTDEQIHDLDDEAFEEASANFNESEEMNSVEGEPDISEGSEEVVEDTVVEETSEHAEATEEEEEVIEPEDDGSADDETETDDVEEEPHNGQEPQPEDEDTEQPSEEADLDYKSMYEDMMGPVKVGGKEYNVKSIADAKKLLGMGFSFSENMQGVKPLRAVGKTLEAAGIITNGVVDEAALMRLVDIQNGDKNALAQLMSEKEIDPLDMETENVNYTPTQSMATEQSVDMDRIEQELVTRGNVDTVIQALGSMDDKSKDFFNSSPENLLKLDDDISNGTYDQIMGAVKYERSLGRLGALSDMEAYIQLASAQSVPEQSEAHKPQANAKPSTAKRKAAGITKRAPANKKQPAKVDLVNMSDEDFEKLAEMGHVI